MKIYFISSDIKKYKEICKLFPFEIFHKKMDIIEIQGSMEEIVRDKAIRAYNSILGNKSSKNVGNSNRDTGNIYDGNIYDGNSKDKNIDTNNLDTIKINTSNIDKSNLDKSNINNKNNMDNRDSEEYFAVLVDDVSLEMKGLDNFPGPYVKYFLGIGLEKIQKIAFFYGTECTAICSLGLVYKCGGNVCVITSEGRTEGNIIVSDDLGTNEFGFDGIFQPKGYQKSYGEMTVEEKNEISHRAVAVMHMVEKIKDLGIFMK
ncbi:RdgB/Ham1-like purine NTP pyrophosphatase [Hamiltosporidium magnivora]|uniref:RdgB/Ham1-like purine NTP pyrophosphatase n=1 Tax=Hamiltosporidium magnivora TaxID=148818 RepID=A0A4Q9KUP2_9MICR|nr:RdgB/Ham1-like purine NTP pyrophosphatase [Hamiltosporidium magnivora]